MAGIVTKSSGIVANLKMDINVQISL
jgi:hypothetical protein